MRGAVASADWAFDAFDGSEPGEPGDPLSETEGEHCRGERNCREENKMPTEETTIDMVQAVA